MILSPMSGLAFVTTEELTSSPPLPPVVGFHRPVPLPTLPRLLPLLEDNKLYSVFARLLIVVVLEPPIERRLTRLHLHNSDLIVLRHKGREALTPNTLPVLPLESSPHLFANAMILTFERNAFVFVCVKKKGKLSQASDARLTSGRGACLFS